MPTMSDRHLVHYAILHTAGPFHLLSTERQAELLTRTWLLQDGYGDPGYTPPQGWDWSGIRDSTDEAMAAMAAEVRRLFGAWGIPLPG